MEFVKNILKAIFVGFCCTIPTIIVGSVVIYNCIKQENKAIEEFPVKIESGYICYYNGEKVDPKKIDISMYHYKVDEENHYIYIADKW